MRKKILIVINLIWILFIFYNSLQTGVQSAAASGSIVKLVYDFFALFKINLDISILSIIIRKLAHVFEYFILSILLLYLLFEYRLSDKHRILYTSLTCLLIAITDEVIQSFVPLRAGRVLDVAIDCVGIILGIVIVIFFNLRKARKNK